MNKKIGQKNSIAICMIALCLIWPLAVLAQSRKPVPIALTSDIGQQVTAHLAAAALKRSGYKTKLIDFGDEGLLAALQAGEVFVQPDWQADDPALATALSEGRVVDMGRLDSSKDLPERRKIIASAMKRLWPGPVKLFGNMSYPTADRDQMIEEITAGATIEDVTSAWMKANPKRWKKWKSVAGNWMKP